MPDGSAIVCVGVLFMQLSEKEIENFIFDDLINNGHHCRQKGLDLDIFKLMRFVDRNAIKIHWYRQLNLAPYGIADIVGFCRFKGSIYVEIIELKAVSIKSDDFDQILRYKKGVSHYLNNTFDLPSLDISCTLIGLGYESGFFIQNELQCKIANMSYGVGGMSFKTHRGESNGEIQTNNSFRKVKPRTTLNLGNILRKEANNA